MSPIPPISRREYAAAVAVLETFFDDTSDADPLLCCFTQSPLRTLTLDVEDILFVT